MFLVKDFLQIYVLCTWISISISAQNVKKKTSKFLSNQWTTRFFFQVPSQNVFGSRSSDIFKWSNLLSESKHLNQDLGIIFFSLMPGLIHAWAKHTKETGSYVRHGNFPLCLGCILNPALQQHLQSDSFSISKPELSWSRSPFLCWNTQQQHAQALALACCNWAATAQQTSKSCQCAGVCSGIKRQTAFLGLPSQPDQWTCKLPRLT